MHVSTNTCLQSRIKQVCQHTKIVQPGQAWGEAFEVLQVQY